MYRRHNRGSLRLFNYEDYRAKALKGRTYDGGDCGAKIAGGTYLYLHEGSYPHDEEHVRLVFHGTDLAHFYPDRIVFVCDGWDTVTTNGRIAEFTPFSPQGSHREKFDKFVSGQSAQSRLHLGFAHNVPRFGLTREPGVTCSWDGQWIPTPDKAGEHVELTLPRAGARSRARKIANKIRKELRPHLALLQGTRIQLEDYRDDEFSFLPYNPLSAINQIIIKWVEREPPTENQKRYLVDCLLYLGPRNGWDINDLLNSHVNVEAIWSKDTQTNEVHYTEVDALLEPRGPEWPESMS